MKANSRRSPLYRDAGFVFNTIEEAAEAFASFHNNPNTGDYVYTRWRNPNIVEAEAHLARLEGANWSLLTSSGMAAIEVALSIYQQAEGTGTWLFSSEIYGGTKAYINRVLAARRGLDVAWFNPDLSTERFDLAALKAEFDRVQPSLFFFEAVTNPILIVTPAADIIRMAKDRGMKVVIDNTFSTPYLWRPLDLGADVVLHSMTKFHSGHGDFTGGVLCGNDTQLGIDAFRYRYDVGCTMSPDDAYRLGTYLRSFNVRYARNCENAFRLAKLLADHPTVTRVRYPGLASHPTHEEAVALFREGAFGAMINFELAGGLAAAEAFVGAAQPEIPFISSLGDAETSLMHVSTVFGTERYPNQGMIRLSVGFEDYAPLESALLRALHAAS